MLVWVFPGAGLPVWLLPIRQTVNITGMANEARNEETKEERQGV